MISATARSGEPELDRPPPHNNQNCNLCKHHLGQRDWGLSRFSCQRKWDCPRCALGHAAAVPAQRRLQGRALGENHRSLSRIRKFIMAGRAEIAAIARRAYFRCAPAEYLTPFLKPDKLRGTNPAMADGYGTRRAPLLFATQQIHSLSRGSVRFLAHWPGRRWLPCVLSRCVSLSALSECRFRLLQGGVR